MTFTEVGNKLNGKYAFIQNANEFGDFEFECNTLSFVSSYTGNVISFNEDTKINIGKDTFTMTDFVGDSYEFKNHLLEV